MIFGIVYIALVTALASGRVAVLLAHDVILEKPREWFFNRYPPTDDPRLGYDYQRRIHPSDLPKGAPTQYLPVGANSRKSYLLSELFTCTRCLTVWTSLPIYWAATTTYAGLLFAEVVAIMAVAAWTAKKL